MVSTFTGLGYGLLLLEISLAESSSAVRLTLGVTGPGSFEILQELMVPSTVLCGSREETTKLVGLRNAPQEYIKVQAAISPIIDRINDWNEDNVLWLRFKKPYGYLAGLPWEQLLHQTNKPVLRLPRGLINNASTASRSSSLLICSSSPLAKEYIDIPGAIMGSERAASRVWTDYPLRMEIFTDLGAVHALRPDTESVKYREKVIHDPQSSQTLQWSGESEYPFTEKRGLESPWLIWMRDSLQGRSIDLVHFVCHAYMSRGRTFIAFSVSPTQNYDPLWSRFIGRGEMLTFLTQIGARAVIFSSPPQNWSDLALRCFADGLSRRFPGAVVYHDMSQDPGEISLESAYIFLSEEREATPPRKSGLFIYCQPNRLRGTRTFRSARVPGADHSGEANLQSFWAISNQKPAWVASTERYIEQCQVKFTGSSTANPIDFISEEQQEDATGRERALEHIRKAMIKFAAETGGL